MNKTEGYLYIATGTQYVEEAIASVNSLRQCNPSSHVTLITDKPIDASYFDEVKILDFDTTNSSGCKNFKVLGLQHSPYDRTFFVDTDTFFIEDCKELFLLLEYHDLLIAPAPADRRAIMINESILEGYVSYNSGVIVFNNNSRVKNLFREWFLLCLKKIYEGDQPPLMHALLTNSVKLYVLQHNYNFRLPFMVAVPGFKVKLLHGRNPDFHKIEKIVNEFESLQRAWNPNNSTMNVRESKRSLHLQKKKTLARRFTGLYQKLKPPCKEKLTPLK